MLIFKCGNILSFNFVNMKIMKFKEQKIKLLVSVLVFPQSHNIFQSHEYKIENIFYSYFILNKFLLV